MSFPFTGPTTSLLLFGLGAPNLPVADDYIARQSIKDITTIIGSSVKIDARHSTLADGSPPKYFYWRFATYPIGSQVARVGFEDLETDSSIVQITPDLTGFYRVELIIGDDNFNSQPVYSDIYVKIIDVPHGQGLTPNVDFIWDYLGDFWNLFSDKKVFSVLWGTYVQIFANRFLSLYQIDFNKSINTIQDLFQKKWLNFNPELQLDEEDSYFILGDDYCGFSAFSNDIYGTRQTLLEDQITLAGSEANLVTTPYGKKVGKRIMRYWESSHNMFRSDFTTALIIVPTTFSLFFTQKKEIINDLSLHPWRLCYTFGSFTKNFDQLGVKVGDRLKLSIQLAKDGKSTGQTSFIYLPVIAVRDNQLGFSFSETLTDGEFDEGLPKEVILQIAKDLQIDGISENILGDLVYLPNTLGKYLLDTLTSISFKKKYYEEQLTIEEIVLGYFNSQKISLLIKPQSVFRHRAISLPESVISIPTLQEYVEQPGFSETPDGKKYVIKDASQKDVVQIYRNPLFLFENLDFITSSEELEVTCSFNAGNKIVFSTFGDFLDRSVEQGDILRIPGLNGESDGSFKDHAITAVRASELEILPLPTFTVSNVKCKLIRRIPGAFIRFVDGAFNAQKIVQPPNLWSEVTFFDNGRTIEDNFGMLVSITREQLKKQQIKSPYRAAVAGLLYGLSKGPSMQNLKIGAQILLGLPFTYYKGKVVAIKPDYQLGDKFEPKIGRITIEETDIQGNPTGLIINYFYPQGTQILVAGKWVPLTPDFSGLAVNPVTGKEYVVGDTVEQFAPLSKGIEIADYLSDPEYVNRVASSFEDQLRKYHTIYLRANTDLFSGADFSFVSNYVKLVKPAFLFLKSALEKDLQDDVNITDQLIIDVILDMFDINGLSLPAANKFDYYNDSPQIFTMDGRLFTRYIKGFDLVTSASTASSQSGGFVTARTNELHDSPYLLAGDRLIIYGGTNNGAYDISSVTDDQTLATSGVFDSLSGQTFAVYREIKNPIWTGTITCTNGSNLLTAPNGDLSAGIAVGDLIFFYNGGLRTKTYRITSISGTSISLHRNFQETTLSYSFVIYREDLLTTYLLSDSTFPFSISFTNGNPWAMNTSAIAKYIPKKGDTLTSIDGDVFDIYDFDEAIGGLYLNPTPGFTSSKNCQLTRSYAPTGFSVDTNTICIQDIAELELLPTVSTATTVSGNAVVTFSVGTNLATWKILPGDFFKLYTGTDSLVDIGYGVGVFVIAECIASQITLTRPLIQTQNTATYSFKRIRS